VRALPSLLAGASLVVVLANEMSSGKCDAGKEELRAYYPPLLGKERDAGGGRGRREALRDQLLPALTRRRARTRVQNLPPSASDQGRTPSPIENATLGSKRFTWSS
jgi:hypothetical protein